MIGRLKLEMRYGLYMLVLPYRELPVAVVVIMGRPFDTY